MTIGPSGPQALVTDRTTRPLDHLVIAAGAFSRRWAAKLAGPVPLDSERGYHLMLANPGIDLRTPVLSGDYRFGIVALDAGVRLAGTAELARVGAAPSYTRAERLLPLAERMLPGLDGSNRTRWMGHRPSTPDSLPVICRSPRFPSVLLAFGHGHLGLTLGAITGRLIADIMAGRDPGVDLAEYDIRRFAKPWKPAMAHGPRERPGDIHAGPAGPGGAPGKSESTRPSFGLSRRAVTRTSVRCP